MIFSVPQVNRSVVRKVCGFSVIDFLNIHQKRRIGRRFGFLFLILYGCVDGTWVFVLECVYHYIIIQRGDDIGFFWNEESAFLPAIFPHDKRSQITIFVQMPFQHFSGDIFLLCACGTATTEKCQRQCPYQCSFHINSPLKKCPFFQSIIGKWRKPYILVW